MPDDDFKVAFDIYVAGFKRIGEELDAAGITVDRDVRAQAFFASSWYLGRQHKSLHTMLRQLHDAFGALLAAEDPDTPMAGWQKPPAGH